MDKEEKEALRENVREVLTAAEADTARAAIEEFGWVEFFAEEAAAAVGIFSSLIGELLAPPLVIDDVVVAAADLDLPTGTRVVYPRVASFEPTSVLTRDGGVFHLAIDGVVNSEAADLSVALIPAVLDDEVVLVTVRSGLEEPREYSGIGAEAGWAAVSGTIPVGDSDILTGQDAAARWVRMRAAGHRVQAHEMIGVGNAILRLAVEHATSREQFGSPLAALQVVKHKLADIRLWQEPAVLAADAAWEDESRESALLAKLLASRYLETARVNAQQLLGGMGFTWEHPFHRHLKRALVLEPLLGSAGELRNVLGSMARVGALPPLAQL